MLRDPVLTELALFLGFPEPLPGQKEMVVDALTPGAVFLLLRLHGPSFGADGYPLGLVMNFKVVVPESLDAMTGRKLVLQIADVGHGPRPGEHEDKVESIQLLQRDPSLQDYKRPRGALEFTGFQRQEIEHVKRPAPSISYFLWTLEFQELRVIPLELLDESQEGEGPISGSPVVAPA